MKFFKAYADTIRSAVAWVRTSRREAIQYTGSICFIVFSSTLLTLFITWLLDNHYFFSGVLSFILGVVFLLSVMVTLIRMME